MFFFHFFFFQTDVTPSVRNHSSSMHKHKKKSLDYCVVLVHGYFGIIHHTLYRDTIPILRHSRNL